MGQVSILAGPKKYALEGADEGLPSARAGANDEGAFSCAVVNTVIICMAILSLLSCFFFSVVAPCLKGDVPISDMVG